MRTVKLITCNESFQARLIKGALENEGIAVAIHNENTSSVLRNACQHHWNRFVRL